MVGYIDLIKTMSLFKHRSLSKMTLCVQLGNIVDVNVDNKPLTDDLVFIEATLLCGVFNRDEMLSSIREYDCKAFVDKIQTSHFLYGTVYVLADKKYVNGGIYSVTGRLSPVLEKKCTYYIAQWRRGSTGSFEKSSVYISNPNQDMFGSECYTWIEKAVKENKIVNPLPIPAGLQITGVELPNPKLICKEDIARIKTVVPAVTSFDSIGIKADSSTNSPFIKENSPEVYAACEQIMNGNGGNADNGTGNGTDNLGIETGGSTNRAGGITNPNDIMRKVILPKSKLVDLIEKPMLVCSNKISDVLNSFSGSDVDYENACIYALADNLIKYWDRKPDANIGSTGRSLFKDAVLLANVHARSKTKSAKEQTYADTDTDGKDLNGVKVETLLDLYGNGDTLVKAWSSGESNKTEIKRSICVLRQEILYSLFKVLLNLKFDILDVLDFCTDRDYSLIRIIAENPYNLCLIDNSISLSDMDILAMVSGVFSNDSVIKSRCIAELHQYLSSSRNPDLNGSTIMRLGVLSRKFISGYRLTSMEYNNLVLNSSNGHGCFLNDDLRTNILSYFYDMTIDMLSLPLVGWTKVGYQYFLSTSFSFDEIYSAYKDIGLGVEYQSRGITYIADYQVIRKEMYILNKVYAISKTEPINEDIEPLIKEFEELKQHELGIPDFKLEDRQREAVKMVGTPLFAITGGAGCGKTTTAEAVVYALQKIYDFDASEIAYIAPTGRAANRLKESIKRDTQTIHSFCQIGSGDSVYVAGGTSTSTRELSSEIKAVIVDESSMINLDIAYTLFNKVPNTIIMIFLGDPGQLPPIGFGRIFADLLTFIPCVTLNVSKRASAKSLVTRNANEIQYNSGYFNSDLETGDDFKCVSAEQGVVPSLIKTIVNYHLGKCDTNIDTVSKDVLGGITADDIQVVTPIRKNTYTWGSDNLNPLLQDIINPRSRSNRSITYRVAKDLMYRFRVNDRVVHIQNMANSPRYYRRSNGMLKKLGSTGVMNGDIGKIRGIYFESEFSRMTHDEELLDRVNDDTLVIEVEYDDVSIKNWDNTSKFSIFYFTKLVRDNYGNATNVDGNLLVYGGMLKLIELAYALTVHKMQGSAAKLIIIPYFDVSRNDFLSRNMIYTAITRASKACYLIGDVVGSTSALAKSRRLEVNSKRLTAIQTLYC